MSYNAAEYDEDARYDQGVYTSTQLIKNAVPERCAESLNFNLLSVSDTHWQICVCKVSCKNILCHSAVLQPLM